MEYKIILNGNVSEKSINTNNSLAISLKGSKRMLPLEHMEENVNEIELYNSERKGCNNIRLSLCVNPICSNLLYNTISEIVKNEGSNDVKCLNYMKNKDDIKDIKDTIFFKNTEDFVNNNGDGVYNAIRDTQLSSEANGYRYHCGVDIFNNHYLRSKTFKTVCPLKNGTKIDFNTIADNARREDGSIINGHKDTTVASKNGDMEMHLYLGEEVLSFKETVSKKLIEENGWFGFTNVGKLKVYGTEKNDNENKYDWFKVINNRKPCDFIDLYPERDLFYFNPKYNSSRRRIEKNWNYCITYPSSSTTEDIEFINNYDGKTSLKAVYFNDTVKNDNGTDSIIIYSVSKHGLKKGDYANIYLENKLIISNAEIIKVFNDYSFSVFSNGVSISSKWVSLKDIEKDIKENKDKTIYSLSKDKKTVKLKNSNIIYYVVNNEKVNLDDNSQNLTYCQVIEGEEVEYYVRIFSKLPNWKYSPIEPNEDVIEKNNEIVKECQKHENEFESHIGKMAFSKNIYNDDMSEIVFTDNIEFDLLKDNLGRPLTDIYFTIIKNNAGYKEWYGKDGKEINISGEEIEYSHCFGKVNCAFELSDESRANSSYRNVLITNNIDGIRKNMGLSTDIINPKDSAKTEISNYNDEIKYKEQINYYGDLCCFSKKLMDEKSIQSVSFRFNTAQRELTENDSSFPLMNTLYYDEIINDDYDSGEFSVITNSIPMASSKKEGYFYYPHYKIPIRTFSKDLNNSYPKFINLKSISDFEGNGIIKIETMRPIYDDYLYLFDRVSKAICKYKVIRYEKDIDGNFIANENMSNKTYCLKPVNSDNKISIGNQDKLLYRLYSVPSEVPSYAKFSLDETCRYIWRDIIENGFDKDSDIEEYPYTSGSLYVNKNINLYLKRQNYNNRKDLRSVVYPFDVLNKETPQIKQNKYYNQDKIEC